MAFDPIAAPEPDLMPAALIARARDMVPFLREQGVIGEAERRVPDAVGRRIVDSGLYRMLQPRCFGGYEADLRSFVDAMVELARGDGSVGWAVCFMAAHNLWITALPAEGQAELFGATGDLRCSMVAIPYGKAVRVPGGYEVTGRWDYNSGGEISNWLGVQALVPGDPPEMVWLFLPRGAYRDHDNWFVTGLKGTGSKQAVLERVFVPAHRALDGLAWQSRFTAPGYGLHANPIYRLPTAPIAGIELLAVALGIALAGLEGFIAYAGAKRAPMGPGLLLREEPKTQLAVGHAFAKIESARAVLYHLVDRSERRMARVLESPPFTEGEIREDALLWQEAVLLCRDALERLCSVAGTHAIRSGNLLERARRDMATVCSHFVMDHDRTAESHGAAALGLVPRNRL